MPRKYPQKLPEALLAPVTDLESGKAWLRALVAAELDFHLEDDPADILNLKTGAWIFYRRDIPLIRERVEQLYAQTWGPDPREDCPIGYLLELTQTKEN